MDIERINATLVKAIGQLQGVELAAMFEAAFSVPTPHEMHARSGMAIPADLPVHGLPKGAEDVTKKSIEGSMFDWRTFGFHDKRFGGEIKPAKKGKLNKSQKTVLKIVGRGLDLPYLSNVLLFADEFKRLKKNERKAIISLAMGGRLKLYKVPGPLPGHHTQSKFGAHADWHYRLVPV